MTVQQLRTDIRHQLPATAVTIGAMLLLPLVVHAAAGPSGGGMWLPLFYAPLLAALLFHPAVSLLAALLAPLLNLWLTGAPPPPLASVLTLELVLFTLTILLLSRRWSTFWGSALLAFVVAKLGSLLLLTLTPLLGLPAGTYVSHSLLAAWPGLLLLLLLNWLLVRGVLRDS